MGDQLPTLHWLTLLCFQVNIWLRDSDHGITFDDVYRSLEDQSLWEMLKTRAPDVGVTGLLFVAHMDDERAAVLHVLRRAAGYLRHSERKRLGITEKTKPGGLALLLALALEAIQQEHWKPSGYAEGRSGN